MDEMSTTFDFSPGQALHIPFVAGHHVKNGPNDVSISMSIIFNTPESKVWKNALNFNHRMRKWLGPAGIRPQPIGRFPARDKAKSVAWRAYAKFR
jgi:hypothetical protein